MRPYIIAPPLLTPSPPPGSFWAERLLGAEDSEGAGRRYEDSDLTRLAPDLGSNRVLLAHGTRDPAAHHAFLLAHSFIAEGSYFTHVVGRLGQGRLAPLGGVVEGERGFMFTFWLGSVGVRPLLSVLGFHSFYRNFFLALFVYLYIHMRERVCVCELELSRI